ncbi:unnamed protein product, partial [Tetraodon nigroviridis]
GQSSQQGQVPPRQAEPLQGEGKRQPLRRRQQGSPPLAQLLAHSQAQKRFAQFHGGSQDHQVRRFRASSYREK